jgi:hypothetical protein
LERMCRHHFLIVSQAAITGSSTLFPYTHGKNPQIKTQSASAWEITRPHKTEITNGLLRQFFPKGTDFKKVSDVELDKAVALINDRPRKCPIPTEAIQYDIL